MAAVTTSRHRHENGRRFPAPVQRRPSRTLGGGCLPTVSTRKDTAITCSLGLDRGTTFSARTAESGPSYMRANS